MKPEKRKYNITDADLLQHGAVVRQQLPGDLDRFASFDTTYTTQTVTDFSGVLDEAKAASVHFEQVGALAQLTDRVNTRMAEAEQSYRTIAYFVRKAFPADRGVRIEFGANEIDEVRQNQSEMIRFLSVLERKVATYHEALLAAGATEALLDRIATLRAELDEADTAQETAKRATPSETGDRIQALNALYTRLLEISEAAPGLPRGCHPLHLPQPPKSGDTPPNNPDLAPEEPAA